MAKLLAGTDILFMGVYWAHKLRFKITLYLISILEILASIIST